MAEKEEAFKCVPTSRSDMEQYIKKNIEKVKSFEVIYFIYCMIHRTEKNKTLLRVRQYQQEQ
ncbi:MAG: hypothetical protein J6C19_05010 [Lachnospiraceae bacterium]|nr:hypothetical protein [Lachnospiraceae bacterium]